MINSYNISYIGVISENFPTTKCHAMGKLYSDIIWGANTPIDQTTLDVLILAAVKRERILDLSNFAYVDITSGFSSSALGAVYYYDSEQEDQINLIGAVTSASSVPFSCRTTPTSSKSYLTHTTAQLLQILNDGKTFKLTILQKYSTKKNNVLAAIGITEVEAITWTSTP